MAFTFVIPILFFFSVEGWSHQCAHSTWNIQWIFFFSISSYPVTIFFQHRTLSHFNAIHIAYLVCSERPRDSRQLQSLDESNLLILLMDLFFFSVLWCWCGTYKKLDFYFVEITLFLPTIFHIAHSTEHSKRNHTWNIDTEEAKKKKYELKMVNIHDDIKSFTGVKLCKRDSFNRWHSQWNGLVFLWPKYSWST